MKTLALIGCLLITASAGAQIKRVTVYNDTTFANDTDTVEIIIAMEPDTIVVHDTVYAGGDSVVANKLDNIISQIPRMEVADSNTWVSLATILDLLRGNGSNAVKATITSDAQYLAFINRVPRPRIVSAQRISATNWFVYYRP